MSVIRRSGGIGVLFTPASPTPSVTLAAEGLLEWVWIYNDPDIWHIAESDTETGTLTTIVAVAGTDRDVANAEIDVGQWYTIFGVTSGGVIVTQQAPRKLCV